MGQYTETPGTGRGGDSVQKVSRKGYMKRVLVQEGGGRSCAGRGPRRVQEGSSCTRRGVHVGFLGQFLARKGGGSCAGRWFLWGCCGTSCAHPALPILGTLPF